VRDAGSGAGDSGNGAAGRSVEKWDIQEGGHFLHEWGDGVAKLAIQVFEAEGEGMAGKGEAVRDFLQMFTVIGFHRLLLKVSKSALRSYTGLTLIHPFITAAAFSDRARVSYALMPIPAKGVPPPIEKVVEVLCIV
jgi:hypothetical protein